MSHKKKHKRKKASAQGTLALIGGILSQAIGQLLGDAAEVAASRFADAQKKASRAIMKKKHAAVDTVEAVAP